MTEQDDIKLVDKYIRDPEDELEILVDFKRCKVEGCDADRKEGKVVCPKHYDILMARRRRPWDPRPFCFAFGCREQWATYPPFCAKHAVLAKEVSLSVLERYLDEADHPGRAEARARALLGRGPRPPGWAAWLDEVYTVCRWIHAAERISLQYKITPEKVLQHQGDWAGDLAAFERQVRELGYYTPPQPEEPGDENV